MVRDVAPYLVETLAAKEDLGECVLVIAAPTDEDLVLPTQSGEGAGSPSLARR